MITSAGFYEVEDGRRRRVAGGSGLPVSRYHSVCANASGDDAGAMCEMELLAEGKAPACSTTGSHCAPCE